MSEAIVAAQCGMGNTSPFQLELDPGITQAQGGVEKVMALLKTHLQQGGTLINVNIVGCAKGKGSTYKSGALSRSGSAGNRVYGLLYYAVS